MLFNVWQ